MNGPLEGMKVLDFSAMIAGPYCTRMLADLGADVVKVEPPDGDFMRSGEPSRAAADGTSHSAYFGALNAGKHSVAIDMKTAEGKQLAMRAALGASRGRLGRVLLSESILLALDNPYGFGQK